MPKKYIHYGSEHFDLNIFDPIENWTGRTKPSGGLWSSPVDSPYYDWKEWCEDREFRLESLKTSFTFMLSPDARVMVIRTMDDVDILPEEFFYNNPYDMAAYRKGKTSLWFDMETVYLNFEAILNAGYDAIELEIAKLYMEFYGWDVDTLLVLNPNAVIEL